MDDFNNFSETYSCFILECFLHVLLFECLFCLHHDDAFFSLSLSWVLKSLQISLPLRRAACRLLGGLYYKPWFLYKLPWVHRFKIKRIFYIWLTISKRVKWTKLLKNNTSICIYFICNMWIGTQRWELLKMLLLFLIVPCVSSRDLAKKEQSDKLISKHSSCSWVGQLLLEMHFAPLECNNDLLSSHLDGFRPLCYLIVSTWAHLTLFRSS